MVKAGLTGSWGCLLGAASLPRRFPRDHTILLLANCGRFMWDFAPLPAVLRGCHSIVPTRRTGYVPRTSRKPAMFRRLVPLLFALLASPALGQEQAMLDLIKLAGPKRRQAPKAPGRDERRRLRHDKETW